MAYVIACELGKTVYELSKLMNAEEFLNWLAFRKIRQEEEDAARVRMLAEHSTRKAQARPR